MRLGISTGGGDCPGLNAVIRAAVKTAVLRYGWEVVGIEDGLRGLLEPNKVVDLSLTAVRGILPKGGTILGSTNRANPFRYPVQTASGIEERDVSDEVVRRASALGLDALMFIGGDGTQAIAQAFREKGMNVIGVPKTIDNDLAATDSTFGFDSAVDVAVDALDRLHTTAESHDRVMLLEVMGRDAGWIALHAGVAGGADVILLPEIPWTFDGVVRKIEDRIRAGTQFSIIVVAEGAHLPTGGAVVQAEEVAGRARRLGGVSLALEDALTARGFDARATVLGHLQRGGSPSALDRILGTRFGHHAVELAAEGRFGRMVCLRGTEVDSVDLQEAAGRIKQVSPDAGMVRAARDIGIGFGDDEA